jgi:hypothetical protein
LRILVVAASLLLLAGCETSGDGWRILGDQQARAVPTSGATTADRSFDAHCVAVARQRATDARANGYSIEMEDTIYQGTYKDCVAWDAQHAQ